MDAVSDSTEQPYQSAEPDASVTVTDVAARAGVSRASVSYALNKPERASKEMLERVHRAAAELGYVGNDAARQLRVGHSRAVGLVVLDAVNPLFSAIAAGAEDSARKAKRYLFVTNSNQDLRRELEYIRFFESQRVSGLIVTPIADIPQALFAAEERGMPFVVIGETTNSLRTNFITGDDDRGGYLAVNHLIAQRRKRILMLTGPVGPVRRRITGAQRAADGANVSLELIHTEKPSIQSGEKAAARLLAERRRDELPDGIFAGNDLLAIGLLHHLLRNGVKVPQDISLVGYDDLEFAHTAMVPLTSIRLPTVEMGSTAVELVVSLAKKGNRDPHLTQLRFAPELVVRDSSL